MVFITEGILLNKKILGEYDEVTTFFTKDYGKIELISFGSRSPRSKRRYPLSRLSWLKIEIEKQKKHPVLSRLEEVKPINISDKDYLTYLLFNHFLKDACFLTLPQIPEPSLYELIKIISSDPIISLPVEFKKFLFNYTLLKEWNALEEFKVCRTCLKVCSKYYYSSINQEIIGKNCLHKVDWSKNTRSVEISLENLIFLNSFSKNYQPETAYFLDIFKIYQMNFSKNFEGWEPLIKLCSLYLKRYKMANG